MELTKIFAASFKDLYSGNENCPDIEAICAYLDNSLPFNSRKTIENHLALCTQCFSEYIDISRELDNIKDLENINPGCLRNKVSYKNYLSMLYCLISYILNSFKKYYWLSWGSGFAFGIAVTIILVIYGPLIYMKSHVKSLISYPTKKTISFQINHIKNPDPNSFPVHYISTNIPDMLSAHKHYQNGENLLSLSKKEEARDEFIQAIKSNPDYAEAHWHLAIIYEEEHNYNEALKHWKRYLSLTPEIGSYEKAEKHMKNLKNKVKNCEGE